MCELLYQSGVTTENLKVLCGNPALDLTHRIKCQIAQCPKEKEVTLAETPKYFQAPQLIVCPSDFQAGISFYKNIVIPQNP